MSKKVLITAGLPYSNGDLHVGHIAGCYLPADIAVRYLRMKGREVKYICGSDDHGVAIVLSSLQENRTPEETVAYFHQRQKEAFDGLGIEFDFYGSTSMGKFHKEISQDFFKKIYDKGLLVKETSLQFYDEKEEMFLPDRYVKGECGFCGALDQNADQCEQCGKVLDEQVLKNPRNVLSDAPVHLRPSAHWFLDMTQMDGKVSEWMKNAILRPTTKNYVQGLVKEGLVKRSMTRDLKWGVPVPLTDDPDAKDKVLYVWFDAPIGYISGTKEYFHEKGADEDEYLKWWSSEDSEIFHFIGEDNTIFHCIIWIAMLELQGQYHLPKGVIVNNFLNIKRGENVEKISKSRKNAIWIKNYLEDGGDADTLRYYLTEISPEKARTNFEYDEFVSLSNAGLADTLGNFINRSVAFGLKFIGDSIPEIKSELIGEMERNLEEEMNLCFKEVTEDLDEFSTRNAIKRIFDFARYCNKYFNDKAPWTDRKTDIELAKVTLYYSYQSIYFLGVLLTPFLPKKSRKILDIFNISHEDVSWKKSFLATGTKILKPEILFEKIEKEE